MIDGRKPKGLSNANKKKERGKGRRKDNMLDQLRRELRLINKTIAALIRLARLREPSRSAK